MRVDLLEHPPDLSGGVVGHGPRLARAQHRGVGGGERGVDGTARQWHGATGVRCPTERAKLRKLTKNTRKNENKGRTDALGRRTLEPAAFAHHLREPSAARLHGGPRDDAAQQDVAVDRQALPQRGRLSPHTICQKRPRNHKQLADACANSRRPPPGRRWSRPSRPARGSGSRTSACRGASSASVGGGGGVKRR